MTVAITFIRVFGVIMALHVAYVGYRWFRMYRFAKNNKVLFEELFMRTMAKEAKTIKLADLDKDD